MQSSNLDIFNHQNIDLAAQSAEMASKTGHFNKLDVSLKKREEFAISLRKAKKQKLLQLKR